MRLKSKLVLTASAVTFGFVVLLSIVFVTEMLRQRIAQTASANDVLAYELRLSTAQALESRIPAYLTQLQTQPAAAQTTPEEALRAAVTDVLSTDTGLKATMEAILRYSPTVEDVSITDANGITLVSTNPEALNRRESARANLDRVSDGSLQLQVKELFGAPRVLDIAAPLDRNGQPFLVVHLGVRSTFLRASYAPWLHAAIVFAVFAAVISVLAAGLLSNLALRPIEAINTQLEMLTASVDDEASLAADEAERSVNANAVAAPGTAPSQPLAMVARAAPPGGPRDETDTVVRVARAIDRLERKMRSNQAGYTALQTNLNQILDTLRDAVILFAVDPAGGTEEPGVLRAVMVSDAMAHFVPGSATTDMIGHSMEEIFPPETNLGTAVLAALASGRAIANEMVMLEDGRQVELSLDPILNRVQQPANGEAAPSSMGTLLTLRDLESALQLEQELELSRRLAAIGRITAGVGHEVKNPINAMVLHLELLRGKLAAAGDPGTSAGRHLDILASEMQRLDRVVQTLADFSRPMDLQLRVVDLQEIVAAVAELTSEQMRLHGVRMVVEAPREALRVYVDSDLIRQALLNLVLNGMESMSDGGLVHVLVRRESNIPQHGAPQMAVVEVRDHGTGIPANLLPRIFELYFTTKKTGTGIGLAMTYRILQLHGGALDVRSDTDPASSDRGSTFTLRLPLSAPGTSALGASVSGASIAASSPSTLTTSGVADTANGQSLPKRVERA
jgi:signal transduction histidine kinase